VLRNITRHDETANRTREAIERQASHLSAMLEDILDFKRIVSRTIVLDPRPCDLGEVVRECITTLKETGRFKDHALAVDLKPLPVNADVVRLNQVLVNLIGNALKYTPPGGSIHVSVKDEGTDAVVRVEDTGIGINADALSRIFDLFVQGDTLTGRVRSGLGVGLAVVRHLVELHGGMVQASSGGRGKGSTFTVRLPRLEGSASLLASGA
jgi:two-component system, sensor histidine kinase